MRFHVNYQGMELKLLFRPHKMLKASQRDTANYGLLSIYG